MPSIPPPPLAPCDLANLRASGLTDATIRANKLHTDTKRNRLVFCYRDLNGDVNCFARYRPHKPGDGPKYLQPPNTPPRAYFPVGSLDKLREGHSDIYITEGEKKSLALDQLGYAAIGLGGVYGFKQKGEEKLIDDLNQIDWQGRDAFIVYDNDPKPTTRANNAKASERLATLLYAAGAATVYNVQLPPTDDGDKQGADDFLVAHGAEAFRELVEQAIPIIKIINAAQAAAAIPVIKIIKLPQLGEAAYHGHIGQFVRAIAPHTEATEACILAHLLPALGMVVGTAPHIFAGNKQRPRLSAVVVGGTNSGRKGTGFAPTDMLFRKVALEFWAEQCASGLSSGEGLIAKLADQREKNDDGDWEVIPVEKRLYVIEPEFSRVLANTRREGNILSQVIREAYDSGNLSTLTVNPRIAFGAHVCIVAHITPAELAERLSHVEMANGFGNRFLWFFVESDKLLPHTEPFPDTAFLPFEPRVRALHDLATRAKDLLVRMDAAAARRWEEVYPALREDQPGLAGAMVARGSSHVLRLALVYCLVDRWKSATKAPQIATDHLEAALAVWRYCEQSALQLFADSHDPLAKKLLGLLSQQPHTKQQLNQHLSLKQKAAADETLARLERAGLVARSTVKATGAGRPATQWQLTTA